MYCGIKPPADNSVQSDIALCNNMKKKNDISDELQMISPLLEKMKQDSGERQPPAGFFDHMQATVMEQISAMEKEEALEETAAISPMLADIKKDMTRPLAPEGYFEGLQAEVFSNVEQHHTHSGGIAADTFRPRIIRMFMALSAAAALFLAITATIRFLQKPETIPAVSAVQQSPAEKANELPAIQETGNTGSQAQIPANSTAHSAKKAATHSLTDDKLRDNIYAYLMEDPGELEEAGIADGLGITAAVSWSNEEMEEINNYLLEESGTLDEAELIETTL